VVRIQLIGDRRRLDERRGAEQPGEKNSFERAHA